MSLLQELDASVHSAAPCFLEFLIRYDPKKKQVFAFYEGDEDSSYYHSILKRSIDKDCELEELVAGCKDNVLKLQREFDWQRYRREQIVFFVDQDLSFWLEEPFDYGENVFVTDEYSVENYVVNSRGFRAWLIHFEGFARASKEEIDNMVSEFETATIRFQEAMMPIMAQAVVAKRHDHSVSLSDFKLTRNHNLVFRIENGHLAFDLQQDPRVLEKWKITDQDEAEIKMQSNHFITEIHHYSVRGKWLLCFMAEIGEFMRLNPNRFAPSLGDVKKLRPTCSVPAAECFSVIAPYCLEPAPERLVAFLTSTYCVYCHQHIS